MSDTWDTVEHLDLRPDWGPEGAVGLEWAVGPEDAWEPGDEVGMPPEAPDARCPRGHLRAWDRPVGQQCRCERGDF